MIIVNNYCTISNKLREIFGPDILVLFDLILATQHIVNIYLKSILCIYTQCLQDVRLLIYTQCLQDVRLLFRDKADKTKDRTLPTPDPSISNRSSNYYM